MTTIEWTERTWNPARGCSRVSPGCDHCYAMRQAHRFSGPGQPYEGLTTIRRGRVDWTGRARFVPEQLQQPLRVRRPTAFFVNSMSDLFHESLTNEQVAAVFGVMAATPQHTYQILTKRPKRMREWFGWLDGRRPLPNVWLGVSCDDQARADERIPHLLSTPAAVRFVSAEPLLGPIALRAWMPRHAVTETDDCAPWCSACGPTGPLPRIDWVIVGGESGPGARPCDVDWIRSIVRQCREAGTACFVKQLGSRLGLRDPKGGDPSEWPEDLRVRETPEA